MLTRFRVALAAALLGVLAIAVPAQGAFYEMTFCHVEHGRAWTISEVNMVRVSADWVIEQHLDLWTFEWQEGHELDYWGACDGSAVKAKPGKRLGLGLTR